jgi:DNA-binding transcriptional ArsR family regulator
MNTYQTQTQLLKAMAHPARLYLLSALRQQEECVCHLTALLGKRQAYVSQQLKYLRDAGLIADRKEGLRVYYHIQEPRVLALLDEVNALAGSEERMLTHMALPACTCPKCDKHGGN